MPVEYRTEPIPGDRSGARNSFAKVRGLEFFAFPYQNYSCRVGSYRAEVSSSGMQKCLANGTYIAIFSASIWISYPNGKSDSISHNSFGTKDEAFEWAADRLLEMEEISKRFPILEALMKTSMEKGHGN